MTDKKTLVLGASPNPSRYSFKAIHKLLKHGHSIIPMGIKKAEIADMQIVTNRPNFTDIHTITMYIGIRLQPQYYEYLISLNPKRIIFNPGTENIEFMNLCKENNIEVVEHCTLIMLNDGIF